MTVVMIIASNDRRARARRQVGMPTNC